MGEKLVYYYCNLSTAVSVLKNREIWMTDIRNLNDSNESIAAYKLFFSILEKLDERNNKLTSLFEFARMPGAIQMYTNPLGAYPEYVACFSENPDSVSQWITYANNGQGMAIGFDESEFERLAICDGLKYQNIKYVSEDDVKKYACVVYEYLINNIDESRLHMMDKAMEQILQIFPETNSYKTVHYASECEKRIIYDYPAKVKTLYNGWSIKNIGVYAKENLINTYIPLGFPKRAIKSIITGPKYEKNGFEVEVAMEALGYNNIEVLHSTSGYR